MGRASVIPKRSSLRFGLALRPAVPNRPSTILGPASRSPRAAVTRMRRSPPVSVPGRRVVDLAIHATVGQPLSGLTGPAEPPVGFRLEPLLAKRGLRGDHATSQRSAELRLLHIKAFSGSADNPSMSVAFLLLAICATGVSGRVVIMFLSVRFGGTPGSAGAPAPARDTRVNPLQRALHHSG